MKKFLALLLCLIAFASLAIPAAAADTELAAPVSAKESFSYDDIDADWYREAVENFGYPDIFGEGNKFEPRKEITRMEFARLLHRAVGININYFATTDIAEYFDDVKNDDVGASNLYDLVTAGIIERGGDFNPDAPLTREEMVDWVIAALDYVTGGNYAMILIMPAPFDDDDKIDEEYKNDIVKAVILGLIQGRGNNMFAPKAGALRAEAVTVISRLVDVIKNLTENVDISAAAREVDGGLEMSLRIVNNTGDTVAIEHFSGQKYDFKIFDAEGENLYTWSANKLFMQMLSTTEIAAGESLVFTEVLSADEFESIKDKAVELRAYIVGTSEDFYIEEEGYSAYLN